MFTRLADEAQDVVGFWGRGIPGIQSPLFFRHFLFAFELFRFWRMLNKQCVSKVAQRRRGVWHTERHWKASWRHRKFIEIPF